MNAANVCSSVRMRIQESTTVCNCNLRLPCTGEDLWHTLLEFSQALSKREQALYLPHLSVTWLRVFGELGARVVARTGA